MRFYYAVAFAGNRGVRVYKLSCSPESLLAVAIYFVTKAGGEFRITIVGWNLIPTLIAKLMCMYMYNLGVSVQLFPLQKQEYKTTPD